MGFSVYWSRVAALLLCPLFMGGNVRCDCTEQGIAMEGGNYTLTKNLEHGSMVLYQCPTGFYPYPAATRTCDFSGNWNPKPRARARQTCRVVECPDPNVLEDAEINPYQERYFVNDVTTYECSSGYTLRGSPSRTCTASGKWSGSTPICSRRSGETCSDPGIPPGGRRTGHRFNFGDKVIYSCTGSKLFLMGSKVRVCQESGEWTGNEPACYYKYTFDTAEDVSQEFGRSIKQSLHTIEARDDAPIQGQRSIKITKDGTLNMYIAVDISESVEEKDIKLATGAVEKLISKIASFATTPNYEIFFFSSRIFKVVDIFDFLNPNENPRETMIDKLNGFNLDERGADLGTDLNGAFKHIADKMAFMKQRAGRNYASHQHVIVLFTDGVYNMGGTPEATVTSIKNMVYGPTTDKDAWKKNQENLDIYIFGVGAQVDDHVLQALETGTGGKHYFRLENLESLQQTFDTIIDSEAVMGLCGLHTEHEGDRSLASRQSMFPWQAYIVIKGSSKCHGSLVTPKFILTAAHCFKFEDQPNHVQVEIHRKMYPVKHFWLHPEYNVASKRNLGVNEFYDFDLALIQIEDYVEFTVHIRPICIPCTKETSEALGLAGGTCRQQEEELLKNDLESLKFLTKTPSADFNRVKNVQAKLGHKRDECISHAKKAKGMKITDAKIAVTDNFLCTGGLTHQRDQISCKGDSGGAVFKAYEHRHIQIGVVSWGTTFLCEGGGLRESVQDSRDFHINLFKMIPFLERIMGNKTSNEFEPLEFVP